MVLDIPPQRIEDLLLNGENVHNQLHGLKQNNVSGTSVVQLATTKQPAVIMAVTQTKELRGNIIFIEINEITTIKWNLVSRLLRVSDCLIVRLFAFSALTV